MEQKRKSLVDQAYPDTEEERDIGCFTKIIGSFRVAILYVLSSVRKDFKVFGIGLISVFLVVFFIGLLQNALKFSSVIFWNIAEDQSSQSDFMLQPGSSQDISAFSEIQELLSKNEEVLGVSPRFIVPGNCIVGSNNSVEQCFLLVQDTNKEKELGIGRNWKHPALNEGECHSSYAIVRKGSLASGDNIRFINTQPYLIGSILSLAANALFLQIPILGIDINQTTNYITRNTSLDFKLVDTIDDSQGKYSAMGSVVIIEREFFVESLAKASGNVMREQGLDTLSGPFENAIRQIDLSNIWLQIVGTFKKRLNIYTQSSGATSKEIRRKSDSLLLTLGVQTSLTILMSTFTSMQATLTIRQFLDQMFLSTLIVLIGLGALLIYTLLLSDVEEKTYEYGMLRALGVSNKTVTIILVTTSELFAIPGTILGIGFSALFLFIAIKVVSGIIHYDIPMYYQSLAIILTVLLGLLIPLVANFYPIYRALTSTLRDSLDLYHQLNSETKVSFISLETMGVSLTAIVMSIIVVALGLALFYGAPSAFLNGNINSFLFIMIWVLMGLLVGLVMISIFFQPFLERLFVYILVCCNDMRFRGLVKKALVSHRSRNEKTAVMFTLSLTFIIFVGSQFLLQSKQIVDSLRVSYGSDLVFTSPSLSYYTSIDQVDKAREEILDQQGVGGEGKVQDIAYSTYSLQSETNVGGIRLGSLAGMNPPAVTVIAVSDNYLNAVFRDFYKVSKTQSNIEFQKTQEGSKDVFQSINSFKGEISLPVEEDLKEIALKAETVITGQINNLTKTAQQWDQEVQQAKEIVAATTGAWEMLGLGVDEDEGQSGSGKRKTLPIDLGAQIILDPFPNVIPRTSIEIYQESIDAVVSKGFAASTNIDLDTPLRMEITVQNRLASKSMTLIYYVKVHSVLTKSPGMSMGTYSSSASGSTVIISRSNYQKILYHILKAVDPLTKEMKDYLKQTSSSTRNEDTDVAPIKIQNILVLTKKGGLKENDRDSIKDVMLSYINQSSTVMDVEQMKESVEETTVILNIFYIVFGAIAIILCFFVLFISFSANVRENGWEFGVLRSIGMTGWQTVRIYVYEASALVLACIVFGTIIGIGVSLILTYMNTIFSELPLTFLFPIPLFCITVGLSLIVAVLGSILAAQGMLHKGIADVIRSGN